MKRLSLLFLLAIVVMALNAQFSVGTDIVSKYICRGVVQGEGNPAIQPVATYETGGFVVGSWASYDLNSTVNTLQEVDLFTAYSFDNGLSIGLTDYYYPLGSFFETEDKISNHAFEVNLGYELDKLSFSGNYILNDASLGAPANMGGDIYLELGYAFSDNVSLSIGGGNGWYIASPYTDWNDMQVTNVCLEISRGIKLSDSFTLPIFGRVIINPNTERFDLVFGFTL